MIEKTHNYFYKITNLVNGKYYYGIHSTNNLEDGYMGSGLVLKKAFKKYGRKNFTKEIIANYSTRNEASDHEARVVTLELVKLEECYNFKAGGDVQSGANHPMYGVKGANNPRYGQYHTQTSKQKMKESQTGHKNHFFGKTHSEDTKKKISDKRIGVPKSKEHINKLKTRKQCKVCEILNVTYISISEASRQLNIPESTVNFRIKSKNKMFKDWIYKTI